MAESRKMKTEKGLALVPGANPLADGCNFAVEVPEDSRASLILYKKRSAKPYVEIPFTEENRTGNVYENVAFAQRVVNRPTRVIRKRVPEVLQEVGLAVKYKSFPDELSGGEQQRVALARALVNRPDILLADEPTGNLDPKTSEEIMKLLEQINDRGTTVVVVTHNKDIVNSMRKRVVTMHEGSIISDEKEGEYHEA